MIGESMQIAYTPGRATTRAVAHLCAPGNSFIAPPAFRAFIKLPEFIKDWNKLSMWEQLGWPVHECLTAG